MSVCDVPVISVVCDTVGQGAATLIAAPFDWLAQAMGGAAAWLFEAVWAVFDTTTLVDLTDPGYIGVYNILFGVAVFVVLIFFCLQLITGLIHRDPAALTRAALGAAKSILGSFVAIGLTGLLLEITDQLALGIVQASGNTMESIGDRITLLAGGFATLNIAAPGVGAIVTIFLAGLAISAAAIVWFSLLIRKALLLVAIVFAPIALAGFSWDATKGWFAKWATFVIALILSKLVLVVIFLVAVTQVSAPIDADLASISDPIAGVVLMFIAAFAPYMTYKFLSFVGFDMYHAMSTEQEAKSALNRPVPMPSGPKADGAKKVLEGGGDNPTPGPGGGDNPTPGPGGPGPGGPPPAPASGGAAPSPATAPTSGAAAGGGATTSAGASGATAGAGAAAAAGPAAAVVIGAQVAGAAVTAGPKLGGAVGGAAEGHATGAEQTAQPAPPPPNSAPTTQPRSGVPAPRPTPPASSAKPASGKE